MVPGRSIVLTLALLSLAAPAAVAECQEVNYPGGSIRQGDCDGASTPTEEESFWTGALMQSVYAVVGLGGSAAAAFFGWTRVRSRRRTLREFLHEADMAYNISKNEPDAGIEKLVGLRAELKARHENSKIEDAQFLELDRRIGQYMAKLRVLAIEMRFPDLPVDVIREIRHVAEDGHLSMADVKRIEKLAASHVPAPTRRLLSQYLHAWAGSETRTPSPSPIVTAATIQPTFRRL